MTLRAESPFASGIGTFGRHIFAAAFFERRGVYLHRARQYFRAISLSIRETD